MLHHSIVQRILKYLAFFMILYLAVLHVPMVALQQREILMIVFVGVTAFGFIDYFYPSVRIENRQE